VTVVIWRTTPPLLTLPSPRAMRSQASRSSGNTAPQRCCALSASARADSPDRHRPARTLRRRQSALALKSPAPRCIGQAVVVFIAFFRMSSGDTFRRKMVKIAGPTFARQRITVQVLGT
jgi:hypothetical protein